MQYFQKSKNGSRKYRVENLPSKSELQKSIQKSYELGKKGYFHLQVGIFQSGRENFPKPRVIQCESLSHSAQCQVE